MNNKIVYVPLAVDILHSGHLNIINKAKKYGKVVIGLLSDKAVAEYKNIPSLEYKERYKIVKNLKNVHKIIKQNTWDYSKVLNSLKPDYFVHGDDWKKGIQKKTRQKVIRSERNSKKTIVRTRLCMVCEHRWHTIQTPERIINDRKAGYLRAS